MKKRVIFCGTPKIASECLKTLLEINEIEVICVFCQPDRINSRNKKINFSEVKQVCLDQKINFYQFEKINDHANLIKELKPDLILTCAYGQMISQEILDIPKYHCVNIHASLLPQLRGGAPIHWAIINGLQSTGITFMYMVKKMDAGDILFQQEINITNEDTYDDLYAKLTLLATQMLKKKINQLFCESIVTIPQNEKKVTYGMNIKKEEEIINFNNKAIDIHNKIRGLYSKPCAKIIFKNQKYKINKCEILNVKSNKQPGTIIAIKHKLIVATLDYDIAINMIQPPNKSWMEWEQFLNGNNIFQIDDKLMVSNE